MKTITVKTTPHMGTQYAITKLLEELTCKELKTELRAHGIAIPKNKEDMADRLAMHAVKQGAQVTLTLRLY